MGIQIIIISLLIIFGKASYWSSRNGYTQTRGCKVSTGPDPLDTFWEVFKT